MACLQLKLNGTVVHGASFVQPAVFGQQAATGVADPQYNLKAVNRCPLIQRFSSSGRALALPGVTPRHRASPLEAGSVVAPSGVDLLLCSLTGSRPQAAGLTHQRHPNGIPVIPQ